MLAHSDGTPLKTDKATLTKTLESEQDTVVTDLTLPQIKATVIDGGIILHETVKQHTYAIMARDLLAKICLCHGEQVHLVLDKYQSPSIKDAEHNLRYLSTHQLFVITGPDQAQRQSGAELLKKWFLQRSVCSLSNGGMQYGLCIFHMVVNARRWNTRRKCLK